MRPSWLLSTVLALIPDAAAAQGDPVGPEFPVNTYTTNDQTAPSVATDSSGNVVAVWTSLAQDGSDLGIFGQRFADSGAPLGSEFRVNTYTTGRQYRQDVAADAAGNFVIVWASQDEDGSVFGVFGQRFASSGVPLGSEFRVNTYTTGGQSGPSVAADPAGNFVIVWHSQDGSFFGVYGQRFASSGAPLGSEFRVNTYTTTAQDYPSVAADSAGNFVVVWTSHVQYVPVADVFGQRFASSGTPLGPEFPVNTYTESFQGEPSVSADASGNFVVVWRTFAQDGSIYGVVGQRYAGSGAPLGSEFLVNTYTTDTQSSPSVTSDAVGNFVVVWQSLNQDGSGDGVFGQRYLDSGAPSGPEFRVNTYTPASQYRPAVAAASSGTFVVVWQSYAQDGSEDGVFGQRYNQIVPVGLVHLRVE